VAAFGESPRAYPPFWSTRPVIDSLLDRMQISHYVAWKAKVVMKLRVAPGSRR
jgi:hypothetical protein